VNFVVDGMLGKLARWLRMMGHDATYSNVADDVDLLIKAMKENRVLLTRDFALYEQAVSKSVEAFYVEGSTGPERLAEISARFAFPLEIDIEKSRCPKCNTKINPIPKKEIAGEVKKNTLRNYDIFWKCPRCGAVYWQGAHWTKIRATLQEARHVPKERNCT
jgi:uncharacterized protein with PIN domain